MHSSANQETFPLYSVTHAKIFWCFNVSLQRTSNTTTYATLNYDKVYTVVLLLTTNRINHYFMKSSEWVWYRNLKIKPFSYPSFLITWGTTNLWYSTLNNLSSFWQMCDICKRRIGGDQNGQTCPRSFIIEEICFDLILGSIR